MRWARQRAFSAILLSLGFELLGLERPLGEEPGLSWP